jgi:anaerobic ribonucleoside-triphosphate reductase
MITRVKKRDGREVPFSVEKIANAVFKASVAAHEQDWNKAMTVAEAVMADLETLGTPGIEEIQDRVEKAMIDAGMARAAKEFILYRASRTRIRERNTRIMQTLGSLTLQDAKTSDLKRENANIDGDTSMGMMLKYGSESAKQFNELFILKPDHGAAHHQGDIHIHDLDFLTLTTTCCQIDIVKLFEGGFGTGHGAVREPNDIHSYAALACIAIQSNQNDQHGGQSIPNFDRGMALGVAKTFARLYRQNLSRALELVGPAGADLAALDARFKALAQSGTYVPRLAAVGESEALEAQVLSEAGFSADQIDRAQSFARRRTVDETDRATLQAMEAVIHNLNTMHSRAGAQVPFSSINYGTDTSPEARMVVRNLLLATQSGMGHGETAVFPIQIFRVKEGINYNPGDPNYDLFQLACATSAQRLFPNFSFQDAPFNLQYYKPGRPDTEIAYMGCRTRVIGNVYDPDRQTIYGRGNLSFTTINLPRLAIEARGDLERFLASLDQKADLVIDQLLERFEIQARKKVKNFPFLMGEGIWIDSDKLKWDDELREVLKHGTLTVGFIGLAECLKALVGQHHGESVEAQALGLEIVGRLRRRCDHEAEARGLNFSLIATPAEGTAGRFVKLDRAKFGSIPGVTDRDYYTNSFHVPVYYPTGAVHKIQTEAPYHALTNAGHISYVELDGDPSKNLGAFEKIIRVMKESGIGYGSVNHPLDRDPVCGYHGVIHNECPGCGRTEGDVAFERIRRITGYLVGTLDRFNDAKRAEERDRVKHGVPGADRP